MNVGVCRKCGRKLSIHNKTGECFHHSHDPEKAAARSMDERLWAGDFTNPNRLRRIATVFNETGRPEY